MNGNKGIRRRGLSMVELVVSMAAMTVLMGALTAAVTIASRAIPNPDSAFTAQIDGFHAIDQIAGELGVAKSFTQNTGRIIEFTVEDRNGDTNDETIRYEWSGTPGGALTRTYNTFTLSPVTVATDVHEFEIRYEYRTESETVVQEQTTSTPEATLASFSGWPGYSSSPVNRAASLTNWVSEYFEINPPAGATSLTFTKTDLYLKGGTVSPLPGVSVGIHRSLLDGTYAPGSTPIGSPTLVPAGALTTSVRWIPVTLTGVTVTDPTRIDYCLVVKGTETTSAWVETYTNNTAPANGMYEQWTTDAGASWGVANKDKNKQDVHFAVYGYFTTTSTQPTTITHQFLQAARIILRIGSDASTRVETSIAIPNEPEVTGL